MRTLSFLFRSSRAAQCGPWTYRRRSRRHRHRHHRHHHSLHSTRSRKAVRTETRSQSEIQSREVATSPDFGRFPRESRRFNLVRLPPHQVLGGHLTLQESEHFSPELLLLFQSVRWPPNTSGKRALFKVLGCNLTLQESEHFSPELFLLFRSVRWPHHTSGK